MLAKVRELFVTAKRRSSPEISSLAGRVMNMRPIDGNDPYNALLADARRLAASVLSQDEEKG